MLNISREILRRVNMLGLVYLVERDKTILERINQEILATAMFTDWNPPVYLDVAEICMAVSLALDWTLDDLPESTIKLAKNALIEKGIHPSWEEYGGNMRYAWWIDHYNNWNQVCNGGLIAASVTIAELLTKNNHGHSTITVDDKRHIVDGYALVNKYKKGKKPSVTFDLTPTFEGQLKSAFRKFTKDSERSLLIEDKIQPSETAELVTWQFMTQADATIVKEGVVLNQDGRKLKLNNLSHPGLEFHIVSLDPPPHRIDKQMDNLKRIELRIPVLNLEDESFNIKVQLTGE